MDRQWAGRRPGLGLLRLHHQPQTGQSCFSAQNGFELQFGLGDAIAVDRLEVYWPDGTARVYRSGLAAGERLVVAY